MDALAVAKPGLTSTSDYLIGCDMVWNDPARTQIVRELAKARFGDAVISDPAMPGGEDFAAFLRVAPETYVFVGAGNEAKGFVGSHHQPKFGLDEDAFPIAWQLAVNVARNAERLAAG